MAELSESEYREHLRGLIDQGVYDPDKLFKGLIAFYFAHDKENDLFWDAQDDMENLFDAMGDILAENFGGQPHGSAKETEDAKRFRKVRNWVENIEYHPTTGILQQSIKNTNPGQKFGRRMDAVMHFIGAAAVAANFGETMADVVSYFVEVGDEGKKWAAKIISNNTQKVGFDPVDLSWGIIGSELQNAFDVSDKKARKLAKKFLSGSFTLSQWAAWYNQSDSVLY